MILMTFEKGNISGRTSFLGKHHSKDSKIKMSEKIKEGYKNGRIVWNKNKKLSKKHIKKLSLSHLGKKLTEEQKIKIGKKARDLWKTPEFRKKMERANEITKLKISGPLNYQWKGGVTPLYKKIRKSLKYRKWRKSVFERDNFTCQNCKKHGGYLQADHIKPFAKFPELRFDLNNGRTLCIDCHRQTETYGSNSIGDKI